MRETLISRPTSPPPLPSRSIKPAAARRRVHRRIRQHSARPTAALISATNPTVFGQTVVFTASVSAVSPGAGTPPGTVTFKDGATALSTNSLSGGQVNYTNTTLLPGTHSITAVYNGDTNFIGSTSGVVTQSVGQANTATAVTSSANPSVSGQAVTFTATVSAVAPGSGTPSGTVQFSI